MLSAVADIWAAELSLGCFTSSEPVKMGNHTLALRKKGNKLALLFLDGDDLLKSTEKITL